MSLSHERARQTNHDQLVQYLLGQLSDAEAEQIDELSVADEETAWRIQAVENDLVDAYVSGELAGPPLEHFEQTYLISPRRREKVRFAESLLRSINRISASTGTNPVPEPDRTEEQPHIRRGARWYERLVARPLHGWGLALATTGLLAIVTTGLLLVQTARLRDELRVAQAARLAVYQNAHDLTSQLAGERVARDATSKELERVRGLLTDAAHAAERPTERTGALAALLLAPQTRSAGTVPTLMVPVSTSAAAFELLLEPSDFRRYQVALKDATDTTVWRSEPQAASVSRGGARALSIIVPVRVLKTRYYAFELSGLGQGGHPEVLAGYAFRIVLRE